ncbi:MAG: hypothetical protein JNK07_04460 [Alphaproteobacteria bacterium]|nr:hypothetical protein [Alphaproteobacteria bacterium]
MPMRPGLSVMPVPSMTVASGHGCDPDNDGRDRLVVDEDRMRSFAGAPVPSMTRTLVMASLNQPPFPPGRSNSCLMPVSTNCQ